MRAREKIIRLLAQKGLTRAAVAVAAGVAYNTFRSYLDDEHPSKPGADIGIAIARKLRVQSDWLWDDGADWPPPDAPSLACFGDAELVDELARRQELILRDLCTIVERLRGGNTLARHESVAARAVAGEWQGLSITEQNMVKAITFDLDRIILLYDQLRMLDPRRRFIERIPPDPTTLLSDYPALRNFWFQGHARDNAGGAFGQESPGMLIPYVGGIGVCVTRERYAAMSVSQQRGYLPVMQTLKNGPPKERPLTIYPGQEPPAEYLAYLRFDSKNLAAFAYQVPGHNMEPRFPTGTLVICEPGEIATAPSDLFAVVFENSRREGVFRVRDNVLSSYNPDHRPFEIDRDDAHFYPVVAVVQPGAAEATVTHVSRFMTQAEVEEQLHRTGMKKGRNLSQTARRRVREAARVPLKKRGTPRKPTDSEAPP